MSNIGDSITKQNSKQESSQGEVLQGNIEILNSSIGQEYPLNIGWIGNKENQYIDEPNYQFPQQKDNSLNSIFVKQKLVKTDIALTVPIASTSEKVVEIITKIENQEIKNTSIHSSQLPQSDSTILKDAEQKGLKKSDILELDINKQQKVNEIYQNQQISSYDEQDNQFIASSQGVDFDDDDSSQLFQQAELIQLNQSEEVDSQFLSNKNPLGQVVQDEKKEEEEIVDNKAIEQESFQAQEQQQLRIQQIEDIPVDSVNQQPQNQNLFESQPKELVSSHSLKNEELNITPKEIIECPLNLNEQEEQQEYNNITPKENEVEIIECYQINDQSEEQQENNNNINLNKQQENNHNDDENNDNEHIFQQQYLEFKENNLEDASKNVETIHNNKNADDSSQQNQQQLGQSISQASEIQKSSLTTVVEESNQSSSGFKQDFSTIFKKQHQDIVSENEKSEEEISSKAESIRSKNSSQEICQDSKPKKVIYL